MATAATTRTRAIVLGILLLALIASALAVWGLGAQDRISSDLYDVRLPALSADESAVEDHALWVISILNGQVPSDAEIGERLSPEFQQVISIAQFRRDTQFFQQQGPFELRGFNIDPSIGILEGSLKSADGQVVGLQISTVFSTSLIDGLFLLFSDADRGPFSGVQAISMLIASWGLLLAGAATWWLRHRPRPARLLLAAGAVWLAQFLELSNTALLYTLGLIAGPVAAALVAAALLSFGARRDASPAARLAGALVVAAMVASISPLLAIDTSVSSLPDQLLSIRHDRDLASLLTSVGDVLTIAALIALAVVLVNRSRGSGGIGAGQRRSVAIAGVVIAAIVGTLALWSLATNSFDLSQSPIVSLAAVAVPVGLTVGTVQDGRHALGGVAAMVADVGEGTSRTALQASLAQALGDPSVALAFWSGDRNAYVDSAGRSMAIEPTDQHAVTLLGAADDPMGAILHDHALLAEPERVRAATAAVRLALENERRQALAAADLRASRSRIVESAEQARRSVERDLHDGAQQRLIALQLSLKLEQQRAQRSGEPVSSEFLAGLSDELGGAINELRELGRGLRPSALDHGLRAAVESLAERSPVPIVTDVTNERGSPAAEAAAYFVINEAVANATRHSGADHIRVRVESDGHSVNVEVADDGAGGARKDIGTGLQSLEDRVVALDGTWSLTSPSGGGTKIEVVLPFATESVTA